MRLTIVGCSGSLPGPESAASCYLVEAPDATGRVWRVLLDLGSGAFGPLHRHGDPRAIDAVLLSHLHPDHCLDLTALYVSLRYAPGDRVPGPVAVWGPAGVAERIHRAHDPLSADHGVSDLEDYLAFAQWQPGRAVTLGPLTVMAEPVRHPVEAYGLRLTWHPPDGAPEVVLGYSGDTDECDGLDDVAVGADVLLCEAACAEDAPVAGVHLTGRQAGRAAARGGVGRLVLTHVPPWNDPMQTLAGAAGEYSGPIDLAHPGMVLQLGSSDT